VKAIYIPNLMKLDGILGVSTIGMTSKVVVVHL